MKFLNKFFLFLLVNSLLVISSFAATYYVDPVNGKDSYTGKTIDDPFLTITKAISTFQAGDTIYLRGEIYTLSTPISISSSLKGTIDKKYNLFAYPGDPRPILDFSSMPFGSSNRGINMKGSYWYIKGIDVKGAGDNGMNMSGSNNIIENCAFYENQDTGLQIGGGGSYNKIINCDSYYNKDPGDGNADGFAPKLDVGSGNYFYGCRSWQNSDDGWDGYMRVPVGADTVTTTLENCWCFKNGYLKNGSPSTGNGNGYKMGGSDQKNLRHNFILKKCISFDNRVKGFDQNNNKGSMTLLNCTGYRNGSNYVISSPIDAGSELIVKNCISLDAATAIGSFAIQEKNTWLAPLSVSDADFVSLDPTPAYGPRKPDGSLPDIEFLHLKSTSSLIDAGVDVGLPYAGNAPDIGAFEYGLPVSVEKSDIVSAKSFQLFQNYPNPFNPVTKIRYSIPILGTSLIKSPQLLVRLKVYDILGNEIATLVNEEKKPGIYEVEFNGSKFSTGVYFYTLTARNFFDTKKFIIIK